MDRGSIERRGMLQTIGVGHARKVPIYHPDAGGEPEQEEQAERDAEPAMDEDDRAFDHDEDGLANGTRNAKRAKPAKPRSYVCFFAVFACSAFKRDDPLVRH